MNRLLVRLLLGILVVLILSAGIAGIWWWKVSELKKNLVHDLETALGAKVEVSSLNLDLWHREIHAAGISLVNERANAPWEKGGISQATVHFRLSKLFSSTLPLNVEVSSWSVVLHPYTSGSSETSMGTTGSNIETPSSSNGRIKVMRLLAREGEVEIHLSDDRKILFHGVSFEATNNGAEVWTTKLKTDSIQAGSLAAGSSSVQLRGDSEKITFANLRVPCDSGMITGEGELSLKDNHSVHLDLKATDVPISMLVGVQWQMKLSGLTSGDLAYEGNDAMGDARGHLTLSAAKINVLPWLGAVTSLVSLPDISNVELDKATTDYEWKNGTIHLSNLDIRKKDILRISGDAEVDPKGQVESKLKLGLPSTVTARWPKLQEKVFSVPFEDYNWTDVHLTGTPDHLQEDLTPRLLSAGAEEGSGLINQGTQKAVDLLKGFLGN